MILFADESTATEVRAMWKTCFGDPDDYMEVYFRHKYRNEQTLVYFDEGKVVASLQMLPYQFTFYGKEIPVLYLSGVCTLPEARKKGIMHQLLLYSFEVARMRNVPLMLLVPQEQWLLNFYAKIGFVKTFDVGAEPLNTLKEAIEAHPDNPEAAYRQFDARYRGQDMTLQKSFDDFCAMAEEGALYHYPTKRNLQGMSRITDVGALLAFYAKSHKEVRFSVHVEDKHLAWNNGLFTVSEGSASRSHEPLKSALNFNIESLTQTIMGYHTHEIEEPLGKLFPKKSPQMHYMLE